MTILSRHHKLKMKFEIFAVKFEKLSFSKVFTKFIFPQGITRLHNCVKFIIGGQFRPPSSYPTLNKLYFFWWNVPTFQPNPVIHSTFWNIFPVLENESKFLPVISSQSNLFYWLCSTVIRRRHIVIGFCTPTQNFWKFFFYIQEFFDVFYFSLCVWIVVCCFSLFSLSLSASFSLFGWSRTTNAHS